jgi:hypothetical protein
MRKGKFMRGIKLLLLGVLAMISPLLLMGAGPRVNGVITANAGPTFELAPSGKPGVLTHTVNGIAQVSLLGNCTVHFDTLAQVPPPGEPFTVRGTMQFVSADGSSAIQGDVNGWVVIDPANPAFGNLHYNMVITGGAGKFTGARGQGEIDGAGMFTSDHSGTATWLLKGVVLTAPN